MDVPLPRMNSIQFRWLFCLFLVTLSGGETQSPRLFPTVSSIPHRMSIENVCKSDEFPNFTTAEAARSTAGQDPLVALQQADGRRLRRLGHVIHRIPRQTASAGEMGTAEIAAYLTHLAVERKAVPFEGVARRGTGAEIAGNDTGNTSPHAGRQLLESTFSRAAQALRSEARGVNPFMMSSDTPSRALRSEDSAARLNEFQFDETARSSQWAGLNGPRFGAGSVEPDAEQESFGGALASAAESARGTEGDHGDGAQVDARFVHGDALRRGLSEAERRGVRRRSSKTDGEGSASASERDGLRIAKGGNARLSRAATGLSDKPRRAGPIFDNSTPRDCLTTPSGRFAETLRAEGGFMSQMTREQSLRLA